MTQHNAVLQRLRALVASERYPPGRRLPTERELANGMAVSRGAVRRALAVLEGEGLVWRHIGKGTFAGSRPERAAPALFDVPPRNASAIAEVRSIFEPTVVRVAAQRASGTDHARMRAQLETMRRAHDPESYIMACEMLFKSIARATHNAIIVRLYEALAPIRLRKPLAGADGEMPPADRAAHSRDLADIVTAILRGDEAGAETAMRGHLHRTLPDSATDRGRGRPGPAAA